jgi:hypothetical protein
MQNNEQIQSVWRTTSKPERLRCMMRLMLHVTIVAQSATAGTACVLTKRQRKDE